MDKSARECWHEGCDKPSEFRLYGEPIVFPVGGGMALTSLSETYLCARHMREQMKKEHERGNSLYIERA
jgi:hypothetical protein